MSVHSLTGRLHWGWLINQTAAGKVPKGRMESIWPDLGPGIGPRDNVGGKLAPQVRLNDGSLADDRADYGFYVTDELVWE